jgi:MFS family permease
MPVEQDFEIKRKKTFDSLWRIIFMIYFCAGIIPVNIDNLLENLPGTTKLGFGISFASYLFVLSLTVLIFGYYEDKITEKQLRKKFFMITNILWVIAFGLISISPNFQFFLIFYITSAIGIGSYVPIGYSIVGDYYAPKDRGKRYGALHLGLTLGSGAGIIIGGLLGTYAGPYGWRFAYGIGFVLGLMAILNYILSGEDPKRGLIEPEFVDLKGEFIYDYKISLSSLGKLLKKKSITAILSYTLLAGIATSVIGSWGIFYLTSKFTGPNPELPATTIYLLAGAGILPGAVIGGKLGDQFFKSGKIRGRVIISLGGLFFGILCLLGFYLIPLSTTSILEFFLSFILLLLLGFLGNMLTSMNVGNIFAIFSDVCAPESRSTANAFNSIMINIGGIIGNLLFSSLIEEDISLLPFAMALVLTFWLLGTLFWLITLIYYPKELNQYRELMAARKIELEKKRTQ